MAVADVSGAWSALALTIVLSGTSCGPRPPQEAPPSNTVARTADSSPAPTTLIPFAIPDPVGVRAEKAEVAADTVVGNLVVRFGPETLPLPSIPDTLALPARTTLELRRIEHAVTPLEWLTEFPKDVVTRFEPGEVEWRWFEDMPLEGRWCVRIRRRVPLTDRGAALRTAFFYPPPIPDPLVLPAVRDTLGLDITECRLGALWVEIEVPSAAASEAFARMVAALKWELGEVDPDPRLGWMSQVWDDYVAWRRGRTRFVVFHEGGYGAEDHVGVGAWISFAGLGLEVPNSEEIAERLGILELRRMVSHLGLAGGLAESVFDLMLEWGLYNAMERDPRPELNVVADALEPWIRPSGNLPPRKRAAVLLVADRLLRLPRAYGGRYRETAEDRRARERLEDLGAVFEAPELSTGYEYSGNLLRDVLELDRDGPIGERAFLYHLATGFAPPDSFEAYPAVIERGEAFLDRELDPWVRAQTHWAVGRAYGAIVALAAETTSESDYLEGEPYATRAPAARRRALEHYRAALEILAPGAWGEEIWEEAWRLAAGLPPMEAHYIFIVP